MLLRFFVALFAIGCSVLISSSLSNECARGFMKYDLLKEKASQISNGGYGKLSSSILYGGRTCVMPSLTFNCSGTITGFYLGVDVRIGYGRNQYPWVGLFEKHNSGYKLVSDSKRYIMLNADDFSSSGLFEYKLKQSLDFENNQMLGVYQQFSHTRIVTMYFHTSTGQHIFEISQKYYWNDAYYKTGWYYPNSTLLLYPVILTNAANCASGFMSLEKLKMESKLITTVDTNTFCANRFYKAINFNCSGIITHVIAGVVKNNPEGFNSPEIRLWRLINDNNKNEYVESGTSITLHYNNGSQDSSTKHLRWYNLSDPVPVQQGDVFGIYQPTADSDSAIYYQEYSGPVHYCNDINQQGDYNVYPLVSVIFDTLTSSTYLMNIEATSITAEILSSSVSVPHSVVVIAFSSATIEKPSSFGSYTLASTTNPKSSLSPRSVTKDSPPFGSNEERTPTPIRQSTPSIDKPTASRRESSSSLVAGVSVSIIALIIITALLIVVPMMVLCYVKRRKASTIGIKVDDPATSGDGLILTNIVYQSSEQAIIGAATQKSQLSSVENTYEVFDQLQSVIEKPEKSSALFSVAQPTVESLYSDINTSDSIQATNSLYNLCNKESNSTSGNTLLYNTLQFGQYVPNATQREQITAPLNADENDSHTKYECINKEFGDFFTEEPIYWDPENNTGSIYEQLAQKKYREMARHEVRVTDHLGSGQFGTVDKGVWNTPRGSVEVAIKTLKGSATEDDEVKFLQEAAINGQFHHPNVVQLCGVVTVGQPIMIILEYVANGNLKSFLEGIRPVPGELADDSLSVMLFKFSQHVVSGMAYLSHKNFIHRDLAARNILVSDANVCKIADFGMSRDLKDEAYYKSSSKRIPVKWTAPEAIYYRKYSTQSDVWSYGAVLYEIWSVGYKPFEEQTNQECINLIESGYRLPAPSGCPRAIYEIMINCWHPNASSRPTFEQLQSVLSQLESLTSPDDDPKSNLGMMHLFEENYSLYPELWVKYCAD